MRFVRVPTAIPPIEITTGPLPERLSAPAGWTVRRGLELPDRPWQLADRRWVCAARVGTTDDAATAVAAVTRGVGLIIAVDLPPEPRHQFLEDLHRVRAAAPASGRLVDRPLPLVGLHAELLDALAEGQTVTAAARQLNISRRTANRLLATARDALEVTATAAAVQRWIELRSRR